MIRRHAFVLLMIISVFGSEIYHTHGLTYKSYLQSPYVREDASTIFIGNDFIEIGFRKDTGALWSVLHKSSGVDLRGLKSDPGESLWDLRLLTTDLTHVGPSGIRRSHPYYMGYSSNQSTNEVEITLEWNRIWLENYGEYPARVSASIKVSEGSQFASFSLKIGNSGSAAIEEVCYPFIWEASKLGSSSSDDALVVPDENGRLFYNPSENLPWWGQIYPSGFCNMQFMAYYDTYAGFYFATYDKDANTKSFFWQKSEGFGVWIGITHYPTINFSGPFALSYDVVLGTFTGDWHSAADTYRNWAYEQWWTQEHNRPPTWLQETAVSKDFSCYSINEWQNKTFDECIQKTVQHQSYFNLSSLLFLWGWEKGGAWSYGDYFPPYEGWNKFDTLVQGVHNASTRLWLPIGAQGILNNSEPWESGSARPYAMINETGSYLFEPFDGKEYVHICPYTEYWQNALKSYVLTLVNHGVDMVQFDGFPWTPPNPCYNATHGHSIGLGGNWFARAWLDVLNETEKAAREVNPDVVFSGEGGAEVYIPFLDVYHSRDSWADADPDPSNYYVSNKIPFSPIPLFNYVYHNDSIFIGEHNLALWKPLGGHDYNGLGLSRILIWGEIPSYNMQESLSNPNTDKELIDYVRKIGLARNTYARDFLLNGVTTRPVEIASPSIQVEDSFGSIHNATSIQCNAWISDNNSIGYVMTDIANTSIGVEGRIDIPIQKPFLAYLLRDGKLDWANISTNTSYNFSFTINPMEIVLLAFTQDTEPWTTVCNEIGGEKRTFDIYASVYAVGGSFIPGINITLHVVPNNVTPSIEKAIYDSWAFTGSDGGLPLTLLWKNSSVKGNYSLWIDVNQNGIYDKIDLYDNTSYVICAFQIIPEFPSVLILPLFMIVTLLAVNVYKRKKRS